MTDLVWRPKDFAFLLRIPTPMKALLRAIDAASGDPPRWVRYAPAVWLQQRPTQERRQRWSRWTRQLAWDGLIERQTERHRDRVTHVRITALGRQIARPTLRLTAERTGFPRQAPAIDRERSPLVV